jgi:AraC-like DNA-binding protein
MTSRVPIVPFLPVAPAAVRVEVQRLDGDHVLRHMGRHAHQFLELVLFDRPGGVHEVAGARRRVRRGDLWAIAPGEAHDGGELGRAEGWLVLFGPEAADLGAAPTAPWRGDARWAAFLWVAQGGGAGFVTLPIEDRERWQREIEELARELARPGPGHREVVAARLTLLLLAAARETVQQDRGGPAGAMATDPLIAAVFAEIEEHFRGALPLERVARSVGRSGAQLSELVRERTGRTVVQWIIERRLAEARRLLSETDAPLLDVADHVGYADVTHFARQFKRAYRLTPGAWRRAPSAREIADHARRFALAGPPDAA